MDRVRGAILSDDVEAINVKAYNAAVFNESDLAEKVNESGVLPGSEDWYTQWKEFPGLDDDPETDSHVTFFYKSLSTTGSLTGFQVDDFDADLIFKLRAQE